MNIRHVFSSPVPDSTATSIVRPMDWNSAHQQALTIAGNTAGASSWSGTNLVLEGGDNLTLSLNGNTLVMSAMSAALALALSAGTQSANSGTIQFADSNGITFGMDASTITASHNGLTTAALSNHSHGNPTLALTNLNGSTASASSGFTLSLSAAAQSVQTQNSVLIQGSTGAISFGTGNGITFGFNASTITASHNGLTTARASNDAIGLNTALTANGVSVTANSSGLSLNFPAFLTTAALSNHSHGNPTLALTNLTGTTASASNGFTLSLSAAPAQTVQPGIQSIAFANTTFTTGAVSFSNANGISFGSSGAQVTASHNGITSQSNQVLTAFAASNTTQGSSGTFNASSMVIAGAGIASVGVTNGSIVISVPAGGGAGDGGVFAGVSNLGNTAGSTGTVSTGNFVLVGSNGISLSQSTGAAGSAATITINGPTFVTKDMWEPCNAYGILSTLAPQGQGSVFFYPVMEDGYVSATVANHLVSMALSSSSNSSHAAAVSMYIGLYTRTGSTLSLASSGSQSYQWSNTSNNSNNSLTGMRRFSVPLNINVTPGIYWVAMMSRSASSGNNWFTGNNMIMSAASNVLLGLVGEVVSTVQRLPGFGKWSSSSSSLPVSVAMSHIIGQGAAGANSMLAPYVNFANFTL